MEGREKPQTKNYKEVKNDWIYDASCMLTSLPVWDLENLKRLIFVAQSVPLPLKHVRYVTEGKLNIHLHED
jgi:hypothetical protein